MKNRKMQCADLEQSSARRDIQCSSEPGAHLAPLEYRFVTLLAATCLPITDSTAVTMDVANSSPPEPITCRQSRARTRV